MTRLFTSVPLMRSEISFHTVNQRVYTNIYSLNTHINNSPITDDTILHECTFNVTRSEISFHTVKQRVYTNIYS